MKVERVFKNFSLALFLCLIAGLAAKTIFAQSCINLGGINPSIYVENFNGLGNSPAPRSDQSANRIDISALPPNNPPASRFLGRFDNTVSDANQPVNVRWAVVEEGSVSSSVSGRYNVGDGSLANGNTYSFASAADPTDRALGSLTLDVISRTYLGSCFTNTSGAAVNTVYISYTGEQWRYGGSAAADTLAFEISTSATSIFQGTFTAFAALNFVSPVTSGTVGARNGNIAPNRTGVPLTAVPVNLPAGATLYIRWIDNRISGTGQTIDNGLAIDDFRITLLAPTAAQVSISGRALRSENAGIAGARLTLTDASGAMRFATTNSFGYYRFNDVAVGETYVIGITSKRYRFKQPERVLTISEDVQNLDFVVDDDF